MRTTYRTLGMLAAGTLAAGMLAACSSSSNGGSGGSSGAADSAAGQSSASSGGTLQSLYTQAKSDPTVVIWTGDDPAELQGAFKTFSKTYPGLKIQITSVNPDEEPTKLTTASAAGQSLPDLIQGRREFMPTLFKSNVIDTNPGWAGYGAQADIVGSDGGIDEYKSLYGLAYNTKLVKDPSTLPSTWDALDDSAWKGKISVDPRGFPFNILAASKGEDATVQYVKSLKKDTSPAIIQGSTSGLEQLAAGAQAIRPAALEDVKTQKANGAPIDFKALSPSLVQDTLWYLTAKAKHKAAAMLFALWFTSADGGQQITAAQDNRTNQVPPEATGDVVTYDTSAKAEVVASVTPKITAALGGQ